MNTAGGILGSKKPGAPGDGDKRGARLAEGLARVVVVEEGRPGSRLETRSQNSRRRGDASSGGLPAMIAPLMAPIEMPATHSGMCRPRQRLVGAGLVGPERPAALQDENVLFLRLGHA